MWEKDKKKSIIWDVNRSCGLVIKKSFELVNLKTGSHVLYLFEISRHV